jgi:hypothetical protein
MILTRYVMSGFELGEELFGGTAFAEPRFFQSLTDPFIDIGAGGDVQEPLVRPGILHDGGSLAFYGQHYGPLTFPELPHEIPRPSPKRRQGLDVLSDVKHGRASFET